MNPYLQNILHNITKRITKLEEAQKQEDFLERLREVHAIQGRDGCWDIDDYMLGLYNGLELALSIMENRNVLYKTRKEKHDGTNT